MNCEVCHTKADCTSAVINGRYYRAICRSCSHSSVDNNLSSGAASFDRRRQYEDHAQDTVQPYSASGPNSEFARLYPSQAEKIFTKAELEQVRRKL